MSEERNPDRDCPFCGGKPSIRNWHDDERNGYAEHWQISCKSCFASTASSEYKPYGEWVGSGKLNIQQDRDVQEQIAHDNWNKRTTDLLQALEGLMVALVGEEYGEDIPAVVVARDVLAKEKDR